MKHTKEMPASVMTNAIENDPHFSIPLKPRLIKELVYINLKKENKIVFEGTGEIQVLKGVATQTLLPQLLPLLDGNNTLQDLYQGVPDFLSHQIYQAIVLLYTRGLLEDASTENDLNSNSFDKESLEFMSRYCDTTRSNKSGAEAMNRISKGTVAILTSEHLVQDLCTKEFKKIGAKNIILNDLNELKEISTVNLIIVIEKEENLNKSYLSKINQICAEKKIPWYLGIVNEETGDLIYIEDKETPCFHCLDTLNKFHFNNTPTTTSDDRVVFWTYTVIQEAIYYISKIAPIRASKSVITFNFENFESRPYHYPFVPGCNCKPIKGESSIKSLNKAFMYEQAVSFPSEHLTNSKSHQNHFNISNLALAHDFKEYKNAPRSILTPYENVSKVSDYKLGQTTIPGNQKVNIHDLSSILLRGAGLKSISEKGRPQRWSPTGGNLGSTELFVFVSKCEELDAGIYFYQAYDHSLALIKNCTTNEIDQIIRNATNKDYNPSIMIVLSSNLLRVRTKYAAFSYRILYLDAGVSSTTMLEMGKAYGYSPQIENEFNYYILEDVLNLSEENDVISNLLLF